MDLSEAREVFIQETAELLQKMEELLLAEVEQLSGDQEIIHSLFRVVHTIKGSAGIFGFDHIEHFTHDLETLMDRVRNGHVRFDRDMVELLLSARDHLQSLSHIVEVKEESTARVMTENLRGAGDDILVRIRKHTGADKAVVQQATVSNSETTLYTHLLQVDFKPALFSHGLDPLPVIRNLKNLGKVISFSLRLDRIPGLAAIDPESCYLGFEMVLETLANEKELRAELEFISEDSEIQIKQPEPEESPVLLVEEQAAPTSPQLAADKQETRFVRVEANRLDQLVNLVGELVINSAHMNQLVETTGIPELIETAYALQKLVADVRDTSFNLRMVPIGGVFSRFQRVVHDLSRELGKEVLLELRGQETELDKSIVEKIYDPLLHLVRNSIDHGLENPETRKRSGKNPRGTIKLNAYHEGSEIVILVQDDGAGLSNARILQKARERGLVRADETPSPREIQNLIFQAGFSTAEKITNVSGRGVGMDVVKRDIQALRGRIDLESEEGKGTRIAIRLPLTLAIIDGLSVRIGGGNFIVPLDIVTECLESKESLDAGIVNLRGEPLPLIHLKKFFSIEGGLDEKENIVVIQHAGQKSGVVVQEILGEVQSVIRPMGRILGDINGVSGSAIMGDGTIALILDIPSVTQSLASVPGQRMEDIREIARASETGEA